jgi:hypothetical protein
MTHIGFVKVVEHAPAVNEEQQRANHQLPIEKSQPHFLFPREDDSTHHTDHSNIPLCGRKLTGILPMSADIPLAMVPALGTSPASLLPSI